MSKLLLIVLAVCAALAPSTGAWAIEVWKVDDVQPGMTGIGRTVLKGCELQEFEFEVLGVLRNTFPQQHIILARLSGLDLENSGVISGMSGSPLYSGGKLLGAVAYGWPFSKEPIAGITPAESMIELIRDQQGFEEIEQLGMREPQGRISNDFAKAPSGSISLTRLRAPLVVSGCPLSVYNRFAGELEAMGMMPVQGGAGAGTDAEEIELAAGMPVAITLVQGDMFVASIGTLTERIGDDVIAYGHPLLELGYIQLPMATAEVVTVIPSQQFSFKMATIGRTVGTLMLDRTEGISGRVGPIPHVITAHVKVNRLDIGRSFTYNYTIAEHPRLTPIMMNACISGSVMMRGALPDEFTIQYKVQLTTVDGDSFVFEDGGSSLNRSVWRLFDATVGAAGTLINNPFEPTQIESVEVEIDLQRGDSTAFIESVSLPRIKVTAGMDLRLELEVMRHRQDPATIDIDVPIPANLPPGIYDIIVCDADGARQIDANQASFRFEPRNYQELLDALRRQYPANRVYTRIILRDNTGLEVNRKALPNLPASYLSMLTPVGGGSKEMITSSISSSTQMPHLISGGQRVQFMVEKED